MSIKNNRKKVKFFDKLNYINKNQLIPFVIRMSYLTFFHAFFEMIITVYILELFVVQTDIFINDISSVSVLLIMVVPLIVVLPLSIFFSFGFSIYYAKKTDLYLYNWEKGNYCEKTFEDIRKDYRKKLALGNSVGVLSYFISTSAASILLPIIYPAAFNNPSALRIWVPIIGTVFGLIWNANCFFSYQRLLWHELLPKSNHLSKDKIAKDNYRYFVLDASGYVLSILLLFAFLIVILLKTDPTIPSNDENYGLVSYLSDMKFLFLPFISLAIIYYKMRFSLLYSEKNKQAAAFPPLSKILSLYKGKKSLSD